MALNLHFVGQGALELSSGKRCTSCVPIPNRSFHYFLFCNDPSLPLKVNPCGVNIWLPWMSWTPRLGTTCGRARARAEAPEPFRIELRVVIRVCCMIAWEGAGLGGCLRGEGGDINSAVYTCLSCFFVLCNSSYQTFRNMNVLLQPTNHEIFNPCNVALRLRDNAIIPCRSTREKWNISLSTRTNWYP